MIEPNIQTLGREAELASLAHFIESARDGPAAALIEGESGMGKTTLWRAGVRDARNESFRVLSCRPAESEVKLPYSALGDLLDDGLDDVLSALADPQRRALEVALLRVDANDQVPDQRAVGVAFLAAIRLLATSGAVLLAIDDVQWLDSSSARVVGFALRRLMRESVGVLATLRTQQGLADPLGLERAFPYPRLHLLRALPLDFDVLARLLRERLNADLPRPILRRLHDVCRGNPFFALEIGRALAQRSEPPEPGEPLPLPKGSQELLDARLRALPAATRQALLVVATMARPRLETVAAAIGAEHAGPALAPAERAGIIETRGERIRFAHPLFGSAVYSGATSEELRHVHGILGEAASDPEERARHLALAAPGPDAVAASALDEAARHAAARGAPDAAAQLSELARQMSPSGSDDSLLPRTIAAAGYHFLAGDVRRSHALLKDALETCSPGATRAELLWNLSEFSWNDVRRCAELSREALAQPGNDERQLVELYMTLSWVGILGGHLPEASGYARRALDLAEDLENPVALAGALVSLSTAECLMGRPADHLMSRALSLAGGLQGLHTYSSPNLYRGQQLMWAGDLDAGRSHLQTANHGLVEGGQESVRWLVLANLTLLECRAGNWEAAAGHAAEAYEIAVEAGQDQVLGTVLAAGALVAALRGEVEAARHDAAEGLRLCERHGDRFWEIHNRSVLGLLELSLGDAAGAHGYLAPVPDLLEDMGVGEPGAFPCLPDEVEALISLGEVEQAESLVASLEEQGTKLDRSLALATSARCRGLVAAARGDEKEAMAAFERAMEKHASLAQPFELGRTLLCLGVVQRRFRQKRSARKSLTASLEVFEELGAPLWSEKTRAELSRISGRATTPGELSETERRVAELAAQGSSNREVADALFVSVKTVEANLRRVYHKLGIGSRRELTRALADSARPDNA